MNLSSLHERMFLIRFFETQLLELFSKGKLNGTTHAYIGQEANAVALLSQLTERDIIWSNHRCHGHYLTFTDDVHGLIHELVGTERGTCAGKGGSQHLCKGTFFTNGVQGSIAPVATGMALAEKIAGSGSIAVVFLGDGTFGEGAVYEALNIAALWKLPILFAVEDNGYAQTTPSALNRSGTIADRAHAFAVPVFTTSTNDVEEILPVAKSAVDSVRQGGGPAMLIMETYRTCPHSKGDDFRDRDEIEQWRSRDPLSFTRSRLAPEIVATIESAVTTRVLSAINEALACAEGR